MEEVARMELPIHSHSCPHCGLHVRYPTVVREQDLDDFRGLMNSAMEVMDKYGITLNLLAEIKATCIAKIVQKKALDWKG